MSSLKKRTSRARQQSKRASKNKAQRPDNSGKAPQFGLAGWVYLIVKGEHLIARGHILYSPSPDNHFIQFGAAPDPVFFRFLSNKSLQEGSLFPNAQEADKFLESYFAQLNASDELRERADANGFTIEQQLEADAEAEAQVSDALSCGA